MDPSLLSPSLTGQQFRPIYSRTSLFAAAFLFGGFGVTFMAWLNARRLGRLKLDAPWLALGLASTAFAVGFMLSTDAQTQTEQRAVVRGAGLLIWLLFNYRHGSAYRAMETFGTAHPSPYKPLVAAFVATVALLLGTVAVYALLGGPIP